MVSQLFESSSPAAILPSSPRLGRLSRRAQLLPSPIRVRKGALTCTRSLSKTIIEGQSMRCGPQNEWATRSAPQRARVRLADGAQAPQQHRRTLSAIVAALWVVCVCLIEYERCRERAREGGEHSRPEVSGPGREPGLRNEAVQVDEPSLARRPEIRSIVLFHACPSFTRRTCDSARASLCPTDPTPPWTPTPSQDRSTPSTTRLMR